MKFENRLVSDVLGKPSKLSNHVGIELEIEGEDLPEVTNAYWKSERDGSLRGESYEYVLRKPIPHKEAQKALQQIAGIWEQNESKIKDSPNAGTHVHVNCSDLTVVQLFNFLSLYLVIEDILIERCGKDRIGNLFCLRSCDAEYLVDVITKAVRDNDLSLFHTDDLRYASVNVKALGDYGSIEFRAWRADGDLAAVNWWVDLLMYLKEQARQIDNPSLIVANVSERSPKNFFEDVLGPYANDIPWERRYEESIISSVRKVQQYAFLGDW